MDYPVYFRVFRDQSNNIIVLQMQDFDEIDYDQSRFMTDSKFESEILANEWIKNDCKSRCIELLNRINMSSACVMCTTSPGRNPFVTIECSSLDGAHAMVDFLIEIQKFLKH